MLGFERYLKNYPLLKLIGNTPLLEIKLGASLVSIKCEWLNPGGSIKDRPVLHILLKALLSGQLNKDLTILDSTSGNAGIAYAMIASVLGIKAKLVMPQNVSKERYHRITSHGAQVHFTAQEKGYDEAIRECHALYEKEEEKYFLCDQYSNQNNWLAHYHTTGKEIIDQVSREPSHLVLGIGTGGSLTGIGRRLKEKWPHLKIVAAIPETFPGIEGLKPIGAKGDIVPAIFDESLIDEKIEVASEEAYDQCQVLAKQGIFVGQSSGAYFSVIKKIAQNETKSHIVSCFKDLGERYFSTGLWGHG